VGRRGIVWLLPLILLSIPACWVAASTIAEPVAERASANDSLAVPVPTATPPVFETPAGFDPYIYRQSGERADPINVIFLHTDAPTAAATSQRVLGWKPVVASGMTFKQRNGVRPTSRQLAADINPQTRYHMRIQAVPITDTQTFVLASVHRDDTAPCGHVGRAFDEMREIVARQFHEAGFPTRIVDLNATAAGLHCDGSRVGGDGKAVLVDLSSVPRVDIPAPNRIPGVY
jgi:hypothetical protein